MNSKIATLVAVLICGLAWETPQVRAQSFRLNTFRAAERADDGFGVRRLRSFEHLRWGAQLSADYAHDPLVLERRRVDDTELARIVRHQLTLKLDVSLSLWNRLLLFAGFDAYPLLKGPPPPAGFEVPRVRAGMGDVSLGARVRLLGEPDDLFALGLQAAAIAATSGNQRYRGEESAAFRPELIAELRPKYVQMSFNVGSHIRKKQRLLDAELGSQLFYAAGLFVPIVEHLEAIGELWGNFGFQDFGRKTTTPVEWLLGGKYRTESGLHAGLAAGRGFSHGVGSPDARVVMQLGYLQPMRAKEKQATKPAVQPPPEPKPEPVQDQDKDGILDAQDACPNESEDPDGLSDEDGCPEPDHDKDGVLDVDDRCPEQAGAPDAQGCVPARTVSEESELFVFEPIRFETNQAAILPESEPSMEAVRKTLTDNPQIKKVRIEGHTDSTGPDQNNLNLSRRRAAAVAAWLAGHGIERRRMTAYGCGELHPVASEETPAGKAQNRRVMFQPIDPAPDEASRKPPAGCVQATSP